MQKFFHVGLIQLLKQIKQFRQISSSCAFYNLEHFLSSLYIHLCIYTGQAGSTNHRQVH